MECVLARRAVELSSGIRPCNSVGYLTCDSHSFWQYLDNNFSVSSGTIYARSGRIGPNFFRNVFE